MATTKYIPWVDALNEIWLYTKGLKLVELGQKTVTAGTAALLTTAQRSAALWIQALYNNSGDIYIGKSDVDSTHCILLGPGDVAEFPLDHEAENVYYDGSVTGDKLNYAIMDREL